MLAPRELNFEDILAMLRRRMWWIIVPTLVLPVAAYFYSATLPYKYTSQTLVLVEQQKVPEGFVKSVVTEQLNVRLATMQEQILSRTRLQPIIERFGLYKQDSGKVPMEDLVDRLRSSITVTPISGNAGLGFTIGFTAENPRLAQQVCAEITSMFIEENLKKREQAAQGTTDFLSNQLDEAKRKLDEQDGRLAAFKQKYMGQLPEQEQANMQMINTLTSQLEAVNQQLSRAQQDKTYLDTMLGQQDTQWKAGHATPDSNPQDIEQQISQLQTQLISLESRYTKDHPDVEKARHQLEQLQAKLDSTKSAQATAPKVVSATEPKELTQLRLQIKFLDARIKEKSGEQVRLQNAIRGYQARIQMAPSVEEQYKGLTRDHATALQFYNQLLSKKTESEMATDLERRQQGEQFRVMDPPNLPERPTFPNRPLFAVFGGVVGVGIGVGLTMLMEFRDRSIRTERDVEYFLQLPTLALMPVVGKDMASEEGNKVSRWKFWKRKHSAMMSDGANGQAVGA